ncbi:MAG: pyridoxal-dependent decarboxylase, partial [Planctomycetota bacterium]
RVLFRSLIDVDPAFALIPEILEKAIEHDKLDGYTPLAVVAATGTTGSTAIDPLQPIGEICKKHNLWLHVDAAFAGSALVLPELRWMINGIEMADSFVFNPHKWMFTNFDCSAYFVKDREALVRTFEIMPEYLKTNEDERVNNYRDWGIPLGRRFRALKLWFVIRSYGVEGIRSIIKNHIQMARKIEKSIESLPDFEMLAPRPLNTLCFRYVPNGVKEIETLNRINAKLLEELNRTGKLYLTHTKLNDKYTLRFVIGQTRVTQKHVDDAWGLIVSTARNLKKDHK